MEVCGQIIAGGVGKILIREKSGEKIELGDLLVSEDSEGYLILQVYDLLYGSQISQVAREFIAGIKLEGLGAGLEFLEPQLRNYVLVLAKSVLRVTSKTYVPKVLPDFFGSVRHLIEKDLDFLTKPPNPIYIGKVRSGSKVLNVDVYLDGTEALSHHILIPATTGRGKSNLVKVMLWNVLNEKKFGILVLDPHDEYYGRNESGLKDHPNAKQNLSYYSSRPPTGANTLIINLGSILPEHFDGIVDFTDPQYDAISMYYKEFGDKWIENIIKGEGLVKVNPRTLSVLQRKMKIMLGVYYQDGEIRCTSKVFSDTAGESTADDIVKALENGKVVVIDTSKIGDEAELLIGSIVANKILSKYQEYKSQGKLVEKPTIGVALEEAPRVLSSDRLAQSGDNIYSKIAREGRKFKVGLIAITQLTSVIPRNILTNMNTKIILGNEMATERNAIMQSAAQDLSDDDRNIASLDKGEAIVSSIFTRFAVPIYVPLFDEFVAQWKMKDEFESEGQIEFEG